MTEHLPDRSGSGAGNLAADVFLVGLRSWQHAQHSGYEGFRRYVGTHLQSPVKRRSLGAGWTWRIDRRLERWLGRRDYSLALMLTEGAAGLHMLRRRRAVYHVLYGDSDYCLLGRIGGWTSNAVVASFHEGEFSFAYYGFDELFFRHLSAAILLCEAQRPLVEPFLPRERIFVVPLGVDSEFFSPKPTSNLERICLTVGGHDRDFSTLSDAITLVRRRDPHVRFVAIGTHIGNKGPYLRSDGNISPWPGRADENVSREPPVVDLRSNLTDEELLSAYRRASLAVFPFNWAGASTGLLEAMACGLPIVATDIGGVREYVGQEAGILCPRRDPAALAAAMLQVLDCPVRAAAMGAAARRQAVGFDYRIVAGQLIAVYAASLRMRYGQA
jgi:glycosyltransferase involved in cell wall biosynthesis